MQFHGGDGMKRGGFGLVVCTDEELTCEQRKKRSRYVQYLTILALVAIFAIAGLIAGMLSQPSH
jgi:hypothetical protein